MKKLKSTNEDAENHKLRSWKQKTKKMKTTNEDAENKHIKILEK